MLIFNAVGLQIRPSVSEHLTNHNHGDGFFDLFFPFIILLIDDIVVFLQKDSKCQEKHEFTAPQEYTMFYNSIILDKKRRNFSLS